MVFVCLLTIGTHAAGYHTKLVFIEIHDLRLDRNPVKSFRADSWKVSEVKEKVNARPGQAVAIVCKGDFPAGMIADDLFTPTGELNSAFNLTPSTTVRAICDQQEDAMRIRNPRLFK